MRASVQGALPKDLMEARSHFEAWRQRRQGRDRIPPSLWALAVRLVRTHGLSRTATALRLDYYSLKKQVETAAGPVPPSAPAFVELTRDDLCALLWAENVLARRYFHPGCHRMAPYSSLDPDAAARLPVTE